MKQTTNEQQRQDLAVKQSSNQKSGKTSLEFHASTTYDTEPLLSKSASSKILEQKLSEFMFEDSHRDLILAGADSQNQVEVVEDPHDDLFEVWQEETERQSHLEAPVLEEDAILQVTTDGIHFPGLQLKTTATVGCKKVMSNGTNSLQITLLEDELDATGSDALVWVFHHLTGTGHKHNDTGHHFHLPHLHLPHLRGHKDDDDKEQEEEHHDDTEHPHHHHERRTHSTNIISAKYVDDSIVFSSTADLTISVSFPSFLLKILPVSAEMAETQGSEAIHKVVTRDIGPSLEMLKKQFEAEHL